MDPWSEFFYVLQLLFSKSPKSHLETDTKFAEGLNLGQFLEYAVNLRLGVNVDHVATLRQARGGHEPEPVAAALLAQGAGAHGITVHLRGDRRHIQERDLRVLKDVLAVPLNVECAIHRIWRCGWCIPRIPQSGKPTGRWCMPLPGLK